MWFAWWIIHVLSHKVFCSSAARHCLRVSAATGAQATLAMLLIVAKKPSSTYYDFTGRSGT